VILPSVPDNPTVAVLLLIILASVGLNVAFVRAVLKGNLVAGSERGYWREAFTIQQDINAELAKTGRATRDVLRALPEPEDVPK
jgi:hypothetical protein